MRPLLKTVTTRSVLAATFVFALAASVAAAPQRGGGHSGGGQAGGGHMSGGHVGGGHFDHGPGGHFDHGARGHFGGPRGRVIIRGGFGGFYDPFWGSYYPYWGYPYAGYPYSYGGYPASVKTEVTPKATEVYVDGYYAGVADQFDGAFTRLHTSPGGHAVTLRLDGYRTVTQNIYVRPDSTFKLKEAMEKLAPGETSAPVPLPTLPDAGKTASDGGSAPQR